MSAFEKHGMGSGKKIWGRNMEFHFSTLHFSTKGTPDLVESQTL
jgi:hypothetical protein